MRIVKKKKGKKRRRKKSKENCQHPIAIHRRRAEKINAENEETSVCVWIAVFAWSVKLHEREDEQVYCPARRVHRRPRRAGSLRS